MNLDIFLKNDKFYIPWQGDLQKSLYVVNLQTSCCVYNVSKVIISSNYKDNPNKMSVHRCLKCKGDNFNRLVNHLTNSILPNYSGSQNA